MLVVQYWFIVGSLYCTCCVDRLVVCFTCFSVHSLASHWLSNCLTSPGVPPCHQSVPPALFLACRLHCRPDHLCGYARRCHSVSRNRVSTQFHVRCMRWDDAEARWKRRRGEAPRRGVCWAGCEGGLRGGDRWRGRIGERGCPRRIGWILYGQGAPRNILRRLVTQCWCRRTTMRRTR